MVTKPFPIAMPVDLLSEIRSAAKETHLSMADVMRQSVKLGLPQLREQHSVLGGVKPFTASERKAAFAPDEFDALAKSHASRSRKPPEAD